MKKFITYILLIISYLSVYAQDVSFVCQVPRTVSAGEPFNIKFKLSASERGKNFKAPNFSGINILGQNDYSSSSSSITIINGKMTSKNTISHTWQYTAEVSKEGTITIPSASVKVNGKIYKTKPVTITVTKGNPNANSRNYNNYSYSQPQTAPSEMPSSNKDIFLNFSTNKTTAYVGEAIYAYAKIYSRYDISLQEFNPSPFNNFWIKELKMPSSVKAERVLYNNKQYITAVLDKRVIFPQKSGTITIDPYNATFQLYDGWGFPAGTKKVVSNRKTINVKPLPANKPANFSGAVGNFNISANIDKTDLYVDDAFSITLTISGLGNFGLFDLPEFSLPTTFERLDPETEDHTTVTTNGISGSKTVKYSYIARVPGEYKIPQIVFSYFDPKKEKYITIKTDTITLKVIGDSTSTAYTQGGNIVKSEVTELGNDIRFIKINSPKYKRKNRFIYGTTGFWLAYIIPLFIFFILIIFLRKKIKENSDARLVRYKKADKVSQKRLKTAQTYMSENKDDVFYEEISKALWGYVSDKFSIPLAELTRDTVAEKLQKHGIREDMINNFLKIIDTCETARFAPAATNVTMQEVYNNAKDIIKNFEKTEIKKV